MANLTEAPELAFEEDVRKLSCETVALALNKPTFAYIVSAVSVFVFVALLETPVGAHIYDRPLTYGPEACALAGKLRLFLTVA